MQFELPKKEELTDEQKNLIYNIDLENPERRGRGENLVVQGFAGTGKTVVAYYRAIEAEKAGKNVLVLCFGKVLKELLKSEKTTHLHNIYHADGLYKDMKKDVTSSTNLSAKTLIIDEKKGQKGLPNLGIQDKDFLLKVINAYKTVHGLKNDEKPFAEIIIDEGQDLTKDFLESLKELSDHICIFADDNQGIFSETKATTVDDMKEIFCPNGDVEYLTQNFRTTKQICQFAAEKFLPENEKVRAIKESKTCRDDPGSEPKIFGPQSYDKSGFKKFFSTFIKKQLNKVIDEGTNDIIKNILIVAPSQRDVEYISMILSDYELEHSIYHSNLNESFLNKSKFADFNLTGSDKGILVTTYHSSKGLEADCVFIYLTKNEYDKSKDEKKKVFYVLSTRAKRRLYLITDFQF